MFDNIEFDEKFLLALREYPMNEQFVKIYIKNGVKEYQGKSYYDYQFKRVNDNEILKLKLLDRQQKFAEVDYDMDINF